MTTQTLLPNNLPEDLRKLLLNPEEISRLPMAARQEANRLLEALEIQNLRLKDFIIDFWEIVEPGTTFVDNWHIDAICLHLEAVSRGEIQNLLINIPPRHMKSLITSVFWPVWDWIKNPNEKWIFSSYGQELATRDSIKCRSIIQSPKFQRKYGNRFQLTKTIEKHLINTWTGERIATSIEGRATGEGAGKIVGDDLHNVLEAESPVKLATVIRYWGEVIPSRLNDRGTGKRVIVMQRTNDGDVAGYWESVCPSLVILKLPVRFNPDKKCVTKIGWSDPRTEKDEILWKGKFTKEQIDEIEAELGEYAFSCQYLQDPVPRGGAIIKQAWLDRNRYRYADIHKMRFSFKIQSWDTAFKTGEENDFSCCVTIGAIGYEYYLLDCWVGKMAYPDLKKFAVRMFLKESPSAVCIEDKGNGTVLLQDMERPVEDPDNPAIKHRLPIQGMPANADPLIRVHAITPIVQANLRMPDDAPWLKDCERELTRFPKAVHDDRVHALTHGLLFLAENHRRIQTRNISAIAR